MKDLRRTYLGLSTACATCHEDKHKGQVGDKCERCHTVAKWKDVTRFDHSTAKYKLTGAHAKVDCAKCHATLPSSDCRLRVIRYTGIPFAQCADCHKDPHRGSFAAGCNSCHNDSVWKPARNTLSTFDHSKTKFPLLGKHAPVACDKCHKTSDFKAPVAHDAVQGLPPGHPWGAICRTRRRAATAQVAIPPMAGSLPRIRWRRTPRACIHCSASMPPWPATSATCRRARRLVYKVRYQECMDCHRDPHAGQFADAAHRNRCEDCHTVDRFQPAKFTLSRHNQTRFPLEGGHVAVACGDCHRKRPELHNTEAYKFTDLSCTGCHLDPHQPQVRETGTRGLSSVSRSRHGLRSLPQRADVASGGELRSFQDPLRSHRVAPRRGLRGVSSFHRAFRSAPTRLCSRTRRSRAWAVTRTFTPASLPPCRKARVAKPVTTTSSGSPANSITSEPVSRWPALMNGCLARIVTAPRRK